jgi:hypothetical protein
MRLLALGVVSLTLGWTGCDSAQVQPLAPPAGDIFQLNRALGRGVNFGNALEAPKEGDWGMTLEEGFFDLIKQGGFKTIRLPISWTHHASKAAPYTINPAFFERVDWAIAQATRRGLNLIVNVHHYDELNANPQAEEARYLTIWKQIAEPTPQRVLRTAQRTPRPVQRQPRTVERSTGQSPAGGAGEQPQPGRDCGAGGLERAVAAA